jgi:hypothetical protein
MFTLLVIAGLATGIYLGVRRKYFARRLPYH